VKNSCTHKGWFGLCPVHIGDLYGEAPLLLERHWIFVPLMWASEAIFALLFELTRFVSPEFELGWPLMVTGELEVPRVVEMDEG